MVGSLTMHACAIQRSSAVLAWLLALAAAACGSVASRPVDAASEEDAPAASDAALSWSAFAPVSVDYAGHTRTPVVSSDGLTLYFLAELSAGGFDYDIYSASRDSVSSGFGVATALLNVNVAGQQARYHDLSSDGLELYFSAGDLGTIMVATRSNVSNAFSAPVSVRTGVAGNFASISGNKLALYYLVHNASGSNIDATLMQITRAAVGQPWSAPAMVPVEGALQIYSSIDISADELSLLRAPTLAPQSRNVLISRRSSKTAPFAQTEVLQSIVTSGLAFASARWSAQDTEIWVGDPAGMAEKPSVSRLQ